MATSGSLQILEIPRVAPSTDSPKSANEFSLPLTLFDTYWLKLPPTECLYFYQLTESTSAPSYFNSEILPSLKHSLSLALAHYLPLAGNLIWPSNSAKPFILYTPNDGVSLTVALSNADNFEIFASHKIYKANELHPLAPQLISSDDKAEIMSLQITLFPYKGFCIGFTSQHAVLDGRTVSMFLRSWAYLCRHGKSGNPCLPQELTPSFDRSLIKDPTGLDMFFLNQWLAASSEEDIRDCSNKRTLKINIPGVVSDEIVRATFEFSGEDIMKLKEKALFELRTTGKLLHLSSFVITLAYTATCLVKAKGGEGDKRVVIDFGVNCRARLDPPLPENYFGCCVVCFESSAKARNFMDENGFAFAVGMVSDLVNKVKQGVLTGAEKLVSNFFPPKLPGLQMIIVSGSPQLNFYRSDFGLGKMKKADIASIDKDESVFMAESRDGGGGIEVGLALKKQEMETFASLFINGLRPKVPVFVEVASKL